MGRRECWKVVGQGLVNRYHLDICLGVTEIHLKKLPLEWDRSQNLSITKPTLNNDRSVI